MNSSQNSEQQESPDAKSAEVTGIYPSPIEKSDVIAMETNSVFARSFAYLHAMTKLNP